MSARGGRKGGRARSGRKGSDAAFEWSTLTSSSMPPASRILALRPPAAMPVRACAASSCASSDSEQRVVSVGQGKSEKVREGQRR